VGDNGSEGEEGVDNEWTVTGGECARGATATMKLTDCNKKACRLETLYNGVWGSVCGENWGTRTTRSIFTASSYTLSLSLSLSLTHTHTHTHKHTYII